MLWTWPLNDLGRTKLLDRRLPADALDAIFLLIAPIVIVVSSTVVERGTSPEKLRVLTKLERNAMETIAAVSNERKEKPARFGLAPYVMLIFCTVCIVVRARLPHASIPPIQWQ